MMCTYNVYQYRGSQMGLIQSGLNSKQMADFATAHGFNDRTITNLLLDGSTGPGCISNDGYEIQRCDRKKALDKMELREIQLSYKPIQKIRNEAISDSKTAEAILRKNWKGIDVYESFYVLHLNTSLKILGLHLVSIGGVRATVVDPKIVLAPALKALSTAIILAHNHPSGALTPSLKDKDLTKRIAAACKLLDISVADHLILTPNNGYMSFADEEIMPT